MRGPKERKVGYIRRLIFSNISSSGATLLPVIFSGVPGYAIEDVKISEVYLHQQGGAAEEQAALQPPENETKYPDPEMFGQIPACGFFLRHMKNLEMSNVEIATEARDPRAAFWLKDVEGADFFRVRVPKGGGPAFDLTAVKDFRHFGSQFVADFANANVDSKKL
jgi:hypothetical protein